MVMRITEIPLIDRLLLLGAPGIGKTERIKQLTQKQAKKYKRIFIDIRLADDSLRQKIIENPKKYFLYMRVVAPHIFPEDIQFPVKTKRDSTEYIKFFTPEDIHLFTLPGIRGVIFLDEITNVTREDQLAMYYSFVLEKELGWNIKISDDVLIIAAGNPPEYSYIVNPPPAAFLSRFVVIDVEPPTINEWYLYMQNTYHDSWDKRTFLYLKMFPRDILATPDEIKSFKNFPCPRSWTELSIILNELKNYPSKNLSEVIVGKIGPRVGAKFYTFIKKKIPAPDSVFTHPHVLDKLDLEEKYLTLWSCAQQENFIERSFKLIDYLYKTDKDLLVLTLLLLPDKKLRIAVIRRHAKIFAELGRDLERYDIS